MSKTPEQWCNEGHALNKEGKKQEAIDAYDEALHINPDFGQAYYGKAIVVADLKRESEAVELYKKAISHGYETVSTYYNMGIDLNTLGRREEAVEVYNKALEKEPKNVDIHRNKGNALMMLGRVHEAEESYTKVLELKSDLYPVYTDLGIVLEELGRRDDALKNFDKGISQDPKNFRSNYAKGCLFYKEGKYQDAIKYLEIAFSINSLHPGVCYHLGSSYSALGKNDKAREFFGKVEQMKPENFLEYCNRGQCYYLLGKKEEAIQDFRKSLELLEKERNPMILGSYFSAIRRTLKSVLEVEKIEATIKQLNQQDPTLKKLQEEQNKIQQKMINKLHLKEGIDGVHEFDKVKKEIARLQESLGAKIVEITEAKTPEQLCDEANALTKEGKKQEALETYDEVINLYPNFGRAYYGKAVVVADLRTETEAIELYKKAIALGHDTAPTYYNMGIDLNALGRREEAIEAYTKALEKDPLKADAYRNRGNCLMMLNRVNEAVESYAKALELKPELYPVYADIGPLLEDMGRRDEALNYYNTCISKDPKNFRSNYSKGRLLYKEGKYQEALNCLEVALEESPLHPGAHYYSGCCYLALGSKDKAMAHFNKADEMTPTLSIQYCNRGQIYFALGQKEKGLEDFKKARELLQTDKKTMLLPTYINLTKSVLRTVLESEHAAQQTEEHVKSLAPEHPGVQKFIQKVKKLREDHDHVQNRIVGKLGHSKDEEVKVDAVELQKFREDFMKEAEAMQKEIDQLKLQVKEAEAIVEKKKQQMEKSKPKQMHELKQEINNNMDEFNKKVDAALDKQNLSSEEKTKLKGYYFGFVNTFSSIYVISNVIDGGQEVKLDAGDSTASFLSFIASFSPFIGDATGSSVNDYLHSQEVTKKARKIKGLGHDAAAFSEVTGGAVLAILTDNKKQKEIIETTDLDVKQGFSTLSDKVAKICEKFSEKPDVYLYNDLYKTPTEKLGHKDANKLLDKWIQGSISPYGIKDEFVSAILKETRPEIEVQTSTSQAKAHNTTCCNLF